MSVKDKKNNRNRNMFYIFAAVTISFVLAIIVSIWSLASLARENTKEIDTMLTYRIYDSISSSLNEPIIVAKTMACNDFLSEFIKNEDSMSEDEAIAVMQQYLSSVKNGLEYDSAFLISEKSRRYYTYEGLNKIVDPENDDHDIWYSIFVEKNSIRITGLENGKIYYFAVAGVSASSPKIIGQLSQEVYARPLHRPLQKK